VRGVIEGFYGPPWSHDARLDVIEFVAERGMNTYVYAPKDDPKHRASWREPYDGMEHARFAELAGRAAKVGVRFGFAVSPGLDMDLESATDRQLLFGKLAPLLDAGVDCLVVAFDDIPGGPGLGRRQGELMAWLHARLESVAPAASLLMVPTEYVAATPTPYLAELAASRPATVDTMWTGPTVCSPVVTAADARARAAVNAGHAPLLWDNYPVNDGPMARSLHLGPYRGREPSLTDVVAGVLVNPMVQPRASKVALATVADYLRDPSGYEPDEAWARAIRDVGGGRAAALDAVARACADGPLLPASQLDAARLTDALVSALDGPDWAAPTASLRATFDGLRAATRAWPADDPLGRELAPWLDQARLEADAALAALRLVQQVRPVATRTERGCRAAAIDPEPAFLAVFGVLLAWSAARSGRDRVVLGPRFAVHPAIVPLPDGRGALDVGLALHENESVVDRLCRVALDDYDAWRRAATEGADGGLQILTGARDVERQHDGTYLLAREETALVRSGARVTRLTPAGGPPFSDPRLG
jgi:hyaluronoglucosaminidase